MDKKTRRRNGNSSFDGSGNYKSSTKMRNGNSKVVQFDYKSNPTTSVIRRQLMSLDESSLESEDDMGYNWEKEKQKNRQFYDDGTMSYFWYVFAMIHVRTEIIAFAI